MHLALGQSLRAFAREVMPALQPDQSYRRSMALSGSDSR